jgi:hypothetical protein
MKKNLIYWPLLTMALFAITFTSCKKETTTNSNNLKNTTDANGVSNTVDANADDASASVGQVSSLSGKTAGNGSLGYYMLCGATVVDTSASQNNKVVTVTYDGSSVCNGVTRSGTITYTLTSGNLWSDQGAVITEVITNLKVTDVSSLNSFTVNGTHTITNETGGLAWELFWNPSLVPGGTVKHRDRSSNMSVTFSDGSHGTWSVDRTRTWSASSGVVTVSISTEASNDEDTWGTNRYGQTFNTTIPTAISSNDYDFANSPNCIWRPYTGQYSYTDPSGSASIKFGTNSSGSYIGTATTTACGSGNSSYGYYLTYTLPSYNYTFNYFGAYNW